MVSIVSPYSNSANLGRPQREQLLSLLREIEKEPSSLSLCCKLFELAKPLRDNLAPALSNINTKEGVETCVWSVGVLIEAAARAVPWGGDFRQEEKVLELAMAIARVVEIPAGIPLRFLSV